MPLLDELLDVLLDVGDGCVIVGHKSKEIDFVSDGIRLLHGRERQDDRLVNGAVDVDVFGVGTYHAHHLKIYPVDLDHLTQWVFASLKHGFIHFLSQEAHLAVGRNVSIVDETALQNLRLFNLVVFGQHAFYRETAAATAVNHVLFLARPHAGLWRDGFDTWERFPDSFQISQLHRPRTTFLIAFVRFAGFAGEEESRVGCHAFHLLHQAVLEPISRRGQDDKQENAPKHTESRQQAAGLVARDGLPNLVYAVEVEHDS